MSRSRRKITFEKPRGEGDAGYTLAGQQYRAIGVQDPSNVHITVSNDAGADEESDQQKATIDEADVASRRDRPWTPPPTHRTSAPNLSRTVHLNEASTSNDRRRQKSTSSLVHYPSKTAHLSNRSPPHTSYSSVMHGSSAGKTKSALQAHHRRGKIPYVREHRSAREQSGRTRDQPRTLRDCRDSDRSDGRVSEATGPPSTANPSYGPELETRYRKPFHGTEENRRSTPAYSPCANGKRRKTSVSPVDCRLNKRRRIDDDSSQRISRISATHEGDINSYVEIMRHTSTSTVQQMECSTYGSADMEIAKRTASGYDVSHEFRKAERQEQEKALQEIALARPPQNFRDVSTAPTSEDFRRDAMPFLRPSVVQGSYDDVDHYLDVQFRLLREDYLIPLREGVEQLRRERTPGAKPVGRRQAKEMRIYHDVNVLNPVFSTKRMVYRIRFNHRHWSVKKVPWHKSSRLKFGSLVCLSSDDFQTMFFASVENRDAKDLRHGQLDVRFENVPPEVVNQFITERRSFKMVESSAYFEAYRHNLEALQSIKEDAFPFKEHIIRCQGDIRPPEYLTQMSTFDLSVIKPKGDSKSGKDEGNGATVPDELEDGEIPDCLSDIQLLNSGTWPKPESLGLNHSQLQAFQLALTKRFALIQGPPGTGKTYVGLKIAQALLHNAKTWQGDKKPPILMISYTNHALDQFLHGLVDAMPNDDINIVRVGGRSKDEVVGRMQLKERRKYRPLPYALFKYKRQLELRMRNMRDGDRIDRAILLLKDSRRCILSFFELAPFMSKTHQQWFARELERADVWLQDQWLLKWLRVKMKQDHSGQDNSQHCMEEFRWFFLANGGTDDKDDDFFFLPKPGRPVKVCEVDKVAYPPPSELQVILESRDVMPEAEEEGLERRLPSVEPSRRWRLYRLWLQRLEESCLQRIRSTQREYETMLSQRQKILDVEDYRILKKAHVIGMTTTCAARNRKVLQKLGPKIILIEEAAEVLESHVVTSLVNSCEHLILIGDHQQLRPRVNEFSLAKKFNLDVSLFERMVQNGIQCKRLSVQHRMRPEIASLMRHVYEDLENHESVSHFEDIKGLKKNMFFIRHSHLEEQDEESLSHSNLHEAHFLVTLCRYLLLQGYDPSQITMLTPYAGQMFALRDIVHEHKEHPGLLNVRISTIDNFQGEESDIILLSLVRSNASGKAGFMAVSNRTCVALSRARLGLYCIGNFHIFERHTVWREIIQDLSRTNSIGETLSLVCQNHQEVREVKSADDIGILAPNGGCRRQCGTHLDCGHTCKNICHPFDLKHEYLLCKEPCERQIRGCTHKCDRLCYQQCKPYCTEKVTKVLSCQHEQEMDCGKAVEDAKCDKRCEKKLECGHQCQAHCGQKCTTQCNERVKKEDWSCGHTSTAACSATQQNCKVPCAALLDCGDICSGTCGECRQGRVHKACKVKCKRLLICSHECGQGCDSLCPPCTKECESRCIHKTCARRCGQPCSPCDKPCRWRCQHFRCSKLCSEMCDRPRCDEPCRKPLSCKHICRGLCGESCVCVICDKNSESPITDVFFGMEDEDGTLFIKLQDCNHIFAVGGLDMWMDQQEEETQAGSNVNIKLKTCPLCETPVRKTKRYGNVVKKRLGEIENVKRKILGDQADLNHKRDELRSKLQKIDLAGGQKLPHNLDRLLKQVNDIAAITNVENRVNLVMRYLTLKHKIDEWPSRKLSSKVEVKCDFLLSELGYLEKRAVSGTATEQVFCQISVEFTRLSLFIELHKIQTEVAMLPDLTLLSEHQKILDAVEKELVGGSSIPEERLDQHLKKVFEMRRYYPSLNLPTKEERQQIVKAVGVRRGAWYKCPQGHFYAVGECGGATQEGLCPECGALIGGRNHQPALGNTHAPEMDQAQWPAWSEQNNLTNYEL